MLKPTGSQCNVNSIFLKVLFLQKKSSTLQVNAAMKFFEDHFVALNSLEKKRKYPYLMWESESNTITIEILGLFERLAFTFDNKGKTAWTSSSTNGENSGKPIPEDDEDFASLILQTLQIDILS